MAEGLKNQLGELGGGGGGPMLIIFIYKNTIHIKSLVCGHDISKRIVRFSLSASSSYSIQQAAPQSCSLR